MTPQSTRAASRLRPCANRANSPAAASMRQRGRAREDGQARRRGPPATAHAQIADRPEPACQTSLSVQTARIDSQRDQALAQDEAGVDRVHREDGQHGHRPERDPAAVSPPGEDVERRQGQQVEDEAARLGRRRSGTRGGCSAPGPRAGTPSAHVGSRAAWPSRRDTPVLRESADSRRRSSRRSA